MIEIPVLETERLILRAPAPQDWEGYRAFCLSARSKHVGGPMSETKAWQAFATEIGHWTIRGFGMWAVTRRDADACLGVVGCWFPAGWPEHELGWLLWPEAEGQGVAFEAAAAARRCAYQRFGWRTAVSYVDQDNLRSIALAERLGARRDPAAAFPGQSAGEEACLVFRHPSPAALGLEDAA